MIFLGGVGFTFFFSSRDHYFVGFGVFRLGTRAREHSFKDFFGGGKGRKRVNARNE